MRPVEPIYVVEMFPPLSDELLTVLKELQPLDWGQPTICSPWSSKDITAHLLGGNIGRLWKCDTVSSAPGRTARSFDEILEAINRANAQWVEAATRISPEILIEFLELTDRRLYEHFKSLDQDGLAGVTVAWASDDLQRTTRSPAYRRTCRMLFGNHGRLW